MPIKEAAEEAENMPEVDTPLTSIDVKRAVRDSCKIKLQNRWASQRGRHMFEFNPSVEARKIAFGSIPAQLRTRYCYLNGYLHAVGLKESPLCTCGEPESVKHFIEECEQYEEIREKFRSRLFFGTGNSEFSCKLFLEVKVEDEFQECRQIISEIFEEYILSLKRFKTQ